MRDKGGGGGGQKVGKLRDVIYERSLMGITSQPNYIHMYIKPALLIKTGSND